MTTAITPAITATTSILAPPSARTETGALHMIRADIDVRAFRRWMGSRQLVDDDHAMHCLLKECFGDIAPKPFRLIIPRAGASGALYGYTRADADELRELASMCACPLQTRVLPPWSVDSKTMPSDWQVDRQLGFEVRIRPIVRPTKNAAQRACEGRCARSGRERDKSLPPCPQCRPRRECDAFQYEAIKHPLGKMERSREEVYGEWLHRRFENKGGARLDLGSAKLVAFQRTRAVRKLHKQYSEGPDAVMRGALTITDADRFGRLVAQGIGRHKAYGYGMLLLRNA